VITRGRRSAILLVAFVLHASCSAPTRKSANRLMEDSPSAALVRELWDAHGGAAAWRKHAAVRFAYEVDLGAEGVTTFRDVAFRLTDYKHLWVTLDGEKNPRVVTLGDRLDIDLPDRVRLALHSIRYLFSLPLASSVGRWEFRQPLGPPDFEAQRLLEIVPLERGAPIGPCLLELEEDSGLVKRFVYAPARRFGSAEPRSLEMGGVIEAGGCRIAATRRSAGSRETVSSVEFLSREEADARYPLPEEPPAAPAPAAAEVEETRDR
jgi:hypothetical protein